MMKRCYDLIAVLRGPIELSRSSSFNHIHHIYRRQYTHERLLVTHFTCYRFKNAHLHCADGLRMMKRCYILVADLRGQVELSCSSSFNHIIKMACPSQKVRHPSHSPPHFKNQKSKMASNNIISCTSSQQHL
jgi:hypothetical protein